MKKYIVVTINNSSTINYDYKTLNKFERKFVNKNTIDNGSFYYTTKYYTNNIKEICEILKEYQMFYDTVCIKKLITFKYVYDLIVELNLQYLRLDIPSTLNLDDYNLFLSINTLKQIDCYFMPEFIKKKFEANNVKINLYNHNKISERFMLQQDSFDYETLYYRKSLDIKEEYPELLNDIKEFLRINHNLKAINIYVFSKDLIESILNLVKYDEARDIIVFLHQGYDKGNFITTNFEWLKELNNNCKEEYMCEFRIVYSNSYLKNNLFKQLTFNNLKLITTMCIYISVVSLIIIKSYDYIDKINIYKLNRELINSSYAADDNINRELEELEKRNEDINQENELVDESNDSDISLTEKEKLIKKYTLENVLTDLRKINKETTGYLLVNNTNISYPVVQHSDNSYYLKHDFYKNKKSVGWVFMDYRNNSKEFDDNTIIYGHNLSSSGMMFGTLKNVLNSKWRSNKNNLIISYDTDKASYKFKIFAAYKVDYTTDYLVTNFDDSESFDEFVNLIRGRSSFKTDDIVKYGDKILTLSTCAGGGNRRLAVHAVLMEE